MKDKSITLSKKDLVELLQKAFDAGWGGYKDLGEDIACQLADDYISSVKKDKEKQADKNQEKMLAMSDKIADMIKKNNRVDLNLSNEVNMGYTYGESPYLSVSNRGVRLTTPEQMYTVSNTSGNITMRQ